MPFIKHKDDNKIKGFVQKKLEKQAIRIMEKESQFEQFEEEDFKNKTEEFKKRYQDGESLDSMLEDAFALAAVAAKKFTGMNPFKVQIMGGLVIHGGNIA